MKHPHSMTSLNLGHTSFSKIKDRISKSFLLQKMHSFFILRELYNATIVDKTAHIAKPELPEPKTYGWTFKDDLPIPTPMSNCAWPSNVSKGIR